MSQVYTDFPQPHWDYPQHPGLSLNISCLSVASPPNPATPISPATNPFSQPQFQFDPHHGSPSQQSPSTAYDEQGLAPPGSAAGSYDRRSRSSSSSSQLPRKRSFPSLAEESAAFDETPSRETPMDLASYDDMDMRTAYGSSTNGGGSPIEGSGNTSGAEDALNGSGSAQLSMALGAVGGSMNVLGKPIATNNFVTKLYQMINDPKSAHFIAWTELGTSFVVSNVGEFSRSILGSHFKHNNASRLFSVSPAKSNR
ncbi:hypothetical protein EST38_g13085 [Candolleomyces aberdarensis]|uniref:HSF-type DNA-binding domain-containing protein n=1 Tax=Candolleomyces aberdarensis TaxID=2316362 RepID=A0A4Q2D1J3_9AGAR|nr:hypothetical protein EST38_g13085 [Candolleomyces aberdarensis]